MTRTSPRATLPISPSTARLTAVLAPFVLAACSAGAPAAPVPLVGPPVPVVTTAEDTATAIPRPAPPVTAETDPAVTALHVYLREQALAVNAGTADPAAVPGFTGSLTTSALEWALPLLAANLGDRMPGPYPVGVVSATPLGEDARVLSICLQDRGWQVDHGTGRPVNQEHFGTAEATVRRVGDRWLVDDVVADGGVCAAGDVVREEF